MLILARHSGESIRINDDIKLTIYYHHGSQVKIGIEAPRHISIMREELLNSVKKKQDSSIEVQAESTTPDKPQVEIKTRRKKRIILPVT
ncbi:MAG: carbon storage regulator [Gammaproteobacteria bacterium]|nr:carbon storage regulator [Gammaproteobacteria bacterium]